MCSLEILSLDFLNLCDAFTSKSIVDAVGHVFMIWLMPTESLLNNRRQQRAFAG